MDRALLPLLYLQKGTCYVQICDKQIYSETVLNETLNKPESYMNQTLNKVTIQEIFVNVPA